MRLNTPWLVVPLAALSFLPAGAQESPEATWSERGLVHVREYSDSIGSAVFLVMSEGEVVASWGRTDRPFRAHSIRKSLLSALVGISIAKGEIDADATLEELGINDRDLLSSEERSASVLQLLASRSGVYHPAAAETSEARAARPQRGSHPPGTHWYYNNWDFNALGTIYSSARGQTVGDAFRDRIAIPLGMEDYDAERHFEHQLEPQYSRHLAYKFRLSARDLARFGNSSCRTDVGMANRSCPKRGFGRARLPTRKRARSERRAVSG